MFEPQPPAAPHGTAGISVHTNLAGTPHAAPLARIFLRQCLRGQVSAEELRTAELLTTELITNAILHARTSIQLGVERSDEKLVVTVRDANPAGWQESRRVDGDQVEGAGRGMLLVATLADDFGWYQVDEGGDKVMWFSLAVSQPGDRGHRANEPVGA